MFRRPLILALTFIAALAFVSGSLAVEQVSRVEGGLLTPLKGLK